MMNKKKVVAYSFLGLILVVLPLGSYYYLNSGLNFYKQQMKYLKNYGELPSFSFVNAKNDTVASSALKGKVIVASFLDKNCGLPCDSLVKKLELVSDQFSNRPDVVVLINDMSDSSFSLQIKDTSLFVIKPLIEEKNKKDWIAETFFLEKKHFKGNSSTYIVLTDAKGMVKNFYNGADSVEINKLITHISLIMPRLEKPKVRFERDNEL